MRYDARKEGSASLGYGIAVSNDSVVVGMPIFNKKQHHKIGGFMKVTQKEFTKFNTKLNELRNKLKVTLLDKNGNLKSNDTPISENFDIYNAYLGWSIMQGNFMNYHMITYY